ncbi:hypothetical protein JQ604_27585 [Bradyrhizobium jicamae]|uniref:hypothetical protein n=1 Tax=Bradyrhizobium jicamae TaxID=280332 RepID=UPI001BACD6C7|nr:hypothetical protein [Bradyrhizobium jicamae]MBR0755952.1 hypothetical protein [Bradyrhizobium jicamae]
MSLTRPGTLAQVLLFVRDGEKFRFCIAGFLDEFYGDVSDRSRAARIADDPGLTGDPKTNALLGAIGEHLSIRWNLGPAPTWTCQPERFLGRPWFMGHERMKGFLLAESPLAFRRRFIFTEAEPLRRASMPRDGRWWAYETIRTGLTPTAEEQAELDEPHSPALTG